MLAEYQVCDKKEWCADKCNRCANAGYGKGEWVPERKVRKCRHCDSPTLYGSYYYCGVHMDSYRLNVLSQVNTVIMDGGSA